MLRFGDESLLFKALGAAVAEQGQVLEADAVLIIYVDEGIEFILLENFGIIGCHHVVVNLICQGLILNVIFVIEFRRLNFIKCLIQILIVNISQFLDLFFNRLGII